MYSSWSTTSSAIGGYSRVPVKNDKRRGLPNLTNTCYISSVLQVLFTVIDSKMLPNGGEVSRAFLRLQDTHDRFDYKQFKEILENKLQFMKGWQQQDAQELLIGLLQILSQQNKTKLAKGKADTTYKQKLTPQENWKIFTAEMAKIEQSLIISNFQGDIFRQFECPKGHTMHTFERFSEILLSFPDTISNTPKTYSPFGLYSGYSNNYDYNSYSPVHLVDLLQHSLKPEKIENVKCEQCQNSRTASKKTYLYSLPPYLIVHLSRFKKGYYKSEKISTPILFDDKLLVPQKKSNTNITYTLQGVINHFGSISRGHYTASIRNGQDWYEYDDSLVREQSIKHHDNQSKYAYIFLYCREETKMKPW